jgi:hypothetical protein
MTSLSQREKGHDAPTIMAQGLATLMLRRSLLNARPE